jgi:purine-cytosine permease-like protein
MNAADLGPVSDADQTQRPFDLFLIFCGANIVATTLQVGASLVGTLSIGASLGLIATGAIGGALLVALLAPLGPRLRVPSIIASRAALGLNGAHVLALLLFVTNFAWIALNNVIAASICSKLLGGDASAPIWAVGLGLVTTVVVTRGPKAVSYADRWAVPMLFVTGIVLTIACLRAPLPTAPLAAAHATDWWRGLDIVFGYQVSWLLMFGDYSRYVKSTRGAAVAVFLGLALTALWFMPLGLLAATIAHSDDPGTMVFALGLGWWGAILITLATVTTNFVNIYMSALALKSLRPATGDQLSVWLIGGLGAALSVLSKAWLDGFGGLMQVIAGTFVPVGGVLLAHYFVLRRPVVVSELYDTHGMYARNGGWAIPGMAAWLAGGVAYFLTESIGGVGPSLATSIGTYLIVSRVIARRIHSSVIT